MKLNEIQQKLKAPKSQYNSFGKYSYRNAEDILEAVKPLLGDSVLVLSDEVVQVGDRNYVKATATLRDGKEETIVSAFACEAPERKGMDSSQITGATSSYARKYALNGLFLIDDTKDADHDSQADAKPTVKPKDVQTDPRAAEKILIGSHCERLGHKLNKDNAKEIVFKLSQLELNEENYPAIIGRLEALLEEKTA